MCVSETIANKGQIPGQLLDKTQRNSRTHTKNTEDTRSLLRGGSETGTRPAQSVSKA